MMPLCRAEGVGVIPWSPLARGFVTGNRKPGGSGETLRAQSDAFARDLYFQPSDFSVVERITEVARARGNSNTQVALAWLLAQNGVTAPIVGVSKMHYFDDLLKALEIKLTGEEMKRLEECYQPHPIRGHS